MSKVYPLLKPADWELRTQVPHWLPVQGVPGAPIVVAAEDMPTGFNIVTQQTADPDGLWHTAIANLAALQYNWEVTEQMGLTLATCSGQDFAAEKVLDPAAMQTVQQLLGTSQLLVAVPRRTVIYAVPQNLSPQQQQVFSRIVQFTYNDSSYGNAPVSPGALQVDGERIAGYSGGI